MSVGGGGYALSNYVLALSSLTQRESYKLEQNIATRKIGLKSAILKRIDLQQNGGPHVPTVLKLVGKMKFLIMIVLYKSKVLTLLVEVLM